MTPLRHNSPTTFETKKLALMWLDAEERLIERDAAGIAEWKAPAARVAEKLAAERNKPMTISEFLPLSLQNRRVRGRPLQERTVAEQTALMRRHILPTLGESSLADVTREAVEHWWAGVALGRETTRRHAYTALHALFADAVDRGLISNNPVRIKGAASATRERGLVIPSKEQVQALRDAMPEERRLMILLGVFCGLRYGEVTALRRKDIDLAGGVVRVSRAVAEVRGRGLIEKGTKTDEMRDVPIPSFIMNRVREHMLAHTQPGERGLLFPSASGGLLPQSSFRGNAEVTDSEGKVTKRGRGFDHARQLAGLPNLRFHDLRHTSATWRMQAGASQAELMRIHGWTTPSTALKYQHYTEARGRELADGVAKLAGEDW